MALRMFVTIEALPGMGDQFAEAVAQRMRDVAPEPGCEQFEVCRSVGRPEVFVLVERWTDQAAYDAHQALNKSRPQMGAGFRKGTISSERWVVD